MHSRIGALTVAFAGGGTGGHLYPAVAIAEAMAARHPGVRILFFGSKRPLDGLVLEGRSYQLITQELPKLEYRPWRWPRMVRQLLRACGAARRHLTEERVAAVVGTGGMASVPAVREARRLGVPTILFNPDAIPGKANRYLARFADVVFVQWEDSLRRFPSSTDVRTSGCPVRPAFRSATRSEGVARFGLDAGKRTLLITGASQGARSINDAAIAIRPFLKDRQEWQTLHLTGRGDYDRVRAAYGAEASRVAVVAYTDYMAEALAAADLVIARAGASTLAELTVAGRASVLMPYPYHRDGHQEANAQCLVRGGAARLLSDAVEPALNAAPLMAALRMLMDDAAAREAMSASARALGRPEAAEHIAEEVLARAGAHERRAACKSLERGRIIAR